MGTRNVRSVISRRSGRRAGATLAVCNAAVIGWLCAAALTIDGGVQTWTALRVQQIADACALAGAGDRIGGPAGSVEERVRAVLAANLAGSARPTISIESVTTYDRGCTVPDYGRLPADTSAVEVVIRATCPVFFSRAVGCREQVMRRRAIATRSASAGATLPAVFASAQNATDEGVNSSAGDLVVDGRVHSNTKVKVTGQRSRFTREILWRNRLEIGTSAVTMEDGAAEGSVEEAPLSYTPEDFAPYDYEVGGDFNYSATGPIPSGVWRVHGNVTITSPANVMGQVTWVADGRITLPSSQASYAPARFGVFAFTTSDDQTAAINASGYSDNCRGIFFAPRGAIKFTGGNLALLDCNIIGYKVQVCGSGFTLRPGGGHHRYDSGVRLLQ